MGEVAKNRRDLLPKSRLVYELREPDWARPSSHQDGAPEVRGLLRQWGWTEGPDGPDTVALWTEWTTERRLWIVWFEHGHRNQRYASVPSDVTSVDEIDLNNDVPTWRRAAYQLLLDRMQKGR